MFTTKPSKGGKALVAIAAFGFVMASSPSAAREYTPDDTKEASGYAAGKGCPGGLEGPNQAANPAAGKPQDKTYEARGIVMVAVPPSESQIMQALCPGRAHGATIEAGDLCPICEQLSRLDFSHKECKDMGTTSGKILIEWECPEAGKKYPEEAVQSRHPMTGADASAEGKPNIACEDAEQVGGQIQFCTQNRNLKSKAEECLQKIDKAWSDAAPELAKLLKGNIGKNATRQNAELQDSEHDYRKARKKIKALIAATKEAAEKLSRYPAVMVDNLKHSKPWCFKDNKEAVQKTVDEVDRKIDEGLIAMDAADKLHNVADERSEVLIGKYGYIKDPDFDRKHHKQMQSDITGIEESRRKRMDMGKMDPIVDEDRIDDKSRSADFERKKHPKPESDITRRDGSAFTGAAGYAGGMRGDMDPSGTFSKRGSLAAGRGPLAGAGAAAGGKGEARGGADSSVGAVLFSGNSDKGLLSEIKLAMGPASAVTGGALVVVDKGAAAPAGGVAATGEVVDDGAAVAVAVLAEQKAVAESGRVPASVPVQNAMVPQSELDLFQRVSARYRTTELFRRARVVAEVGKGAREEY